MTPSARRELMHDEPVRKRDETVSSWAYIYGQPEADPVADGS